MMIVWLSVSFNHNSFSVLSFPSIAHTFYTVMWDGGILTTCIKSAKTYYIIQLHFITLKKILPLSARARSCELEESRHPSYVAALQGLLADFLSGEFLLSTPSS